jgi:type II secretory pathway pseudopilin PulG
MKRNRGELGFTLIELLVATLLFMLVSVGFYQVMFTGVRNARTGESLARVSEEARIGLNRMLRETREATKLLVPIDGNSYKIEIDRDGDGPGAPIQLIFARTGDKLTMKQVGTPGAPEVLVNGITPQAGSTGIFSFSSHLLQYDIGPPYPASAGSPDGVTDWWDLDQSGCTPRLPPPGNCDGALGPEELVNLSRVEYAFDIHVGDAQADFVGEAHIRAVWRGL